MKNIVVEKGEQASWKINVGIKGEKRKMRSCKGNKTTPPLAINPGALHHFKAEAEIVLGSSRSTHCCQPLI